MGKIVATCLRMIWVKFAKEGISTSFFHFEDPHQQQVMSMMLLGISPLPVLKAEIESLHDRDIESQLKRWLESMYADGTLQLDYKSSGDDC